MLFGNIAAAVCTVIAVAALIWVHKLEHPKEIDNDASERSTNTKAKEEEKEE